MTTIRTTDKVAAALPALRDLQWMARRAASAPNLADAASRFNTATWLLEEALGRHGYDPLRPDRAANTTFLPEGGFTETPSIWTDGTDNDFTPDPALLTDADGDDETRLQWVASVLHPLAYGYADGRATYASSLFNSATRHLRAAGYDLTTTTEQYGTVWVRDGMGDGFDGLTHAERAERDAVNGP